MFSNSTGDSSSESLRQSELKYRTLFETANDAIFMMTADKFIDCNTKTLEMFGCSSKEEIIGHHPAEFSPTRQPDGQDSMRAAKALITQALQGKSLSFYWKHCTLDKIPFDAQVSLNKITLDEHDYLQAIVRDVTEQKEAERELTESRSRFKSIIENTQGIVFMLDQNLRFILSEGRGLSALNLNPGEIVGQTAFDVYKEYPAVIENLKKALNGEVVRDIVFVSEHYFDTFFSGWKDKHNNPQVIGMAIDVTEQQTAQKRLEEIDALKTEFLSTASHQLRSPLGSMRWKIELMLDSAEIQTCKSFLEPLQELHAMNLRVIELVNHLLNVTRIEEKRSFSKPSRFDMKELIASLISDYKEKIDEKQLRLRHKKFDEPLIVFADENEIREAVSNLLSNAIKYNREAGEIQISCECDENYVNFSIANTGLSIPEKDHPKVFTKFFRSEDASSSDVEGSGLGLFVAKSYIKNAGGEVYFESPTQIETVHGEEMGTRFSFSLPLRPVE